MSAQLEFYLERAAEARAIADAATLDNVRDRWLRSEASWTEMAVRREHADNMRVKLIAEKATERAALNPASQARGPASRTGKGLTT
jgi:urease accessory protein UreF